MRLEETRRFAYIELETVAEDTAQGTGYHASGTVGQRACKKCIQQSMPFYCTKDESYVLSKRNTV